MPEGRLHISSTPPIIPDDADFGIYINFEKGTVNPQRVFQSADALIRALQKLDEIFCETIDSNIKPVLVLEDVQAGSLIIKLKNLLEVTDDQALRDLDFKKIIGSYLVKAKYVYIEWVNNTEKQKSVIDLSRNIQRIAAETNVKFLPDYKPPSVEDLINVAYDIEKAKSFLNEGDKLSYTSQNDADIEFDLSISWTSEQLSDLLTKETNKSSPAPMILAVKKPDYLGNSKWELRHGKRSINAKIDDQDWLSRFQNREVDVRPGDALRCSVIIERSYGYDNELVAEVYYIVEVLEVVENQYRQASFFDHES